MCVLDWLVNKWLVSFLFSFFGRVQQQPVSGFQGDFHRTHFLFHILRHALYYPLAHVRGTLRPGIETLLDLAGFDRLLERADLVITGEGRLDGQSLRGKVISGVARRAKGRVPVIAIVGGIADDAVPAYGLGVDAMFSIDRAALPFSESAPRSAADYRATLRDVLRVWQLGRVGHSH